MGIGLHGGGIQEEVPIGSVARNVRAPGCVVHAALIGGRHKVGRIP